MFKKKYGFKKRSGTGFSKRKKGGRRKTRRITRYGSSRGGIRL